jgi:tetratricopeptide (TPR) repeat protein
LRPTPSGDAVPAARRCLGILLCLALAACATTERRGERALSLGRYDDAIHLFQAALAEHPDRLQARLGLGVALYKAGALPDAAVTLDEVLARAPADGTALLYRGLIAIRQRDDAAAGERLTRFRDVARIARFDAHLDGALRVLRSGEAVGAETREFIAVSLEEAVRSAREVEDARLAAQRAHLSAFPPVRCAPTRRGWICF